MCAVGWFVYMDNDVFSKYVVVNSKWELHKNSDDVKIRELWGISLGSEMMARCLGVRNVSDIVKSEIIKFNHVYEYYMRKVYRISDFLCYRDVGPRGRDVIFKGYNVDPWGREFPCYIENLYSDYYKFSNNKVKYGYWLVYKDSFITNDSMRGKKCRYDEPPLMVLTTTSIEGVTIACLDMVDWS